MGVPKTNQKMMGIKMQAILRSLSYLVKKILDSVSGFLKREKCLVSPRFYALCIYCGPSLLSITEEKMGSHKLKCQKLGL